MVPDKYKKTSAEKRQSRGAKSPWARFGAKKVERTDRWHKTKYSSPPIKLLQFIKAHNISYDDLLALLTEHYEDDEPSPTREASLATANQVIMTGERDYIEGGGISSLVCEVLPVQPIAAAPPQPSALPVEINQPPDPAPLPSVDTGASPRPPKSRRVVTSPTPHHLNEHCAAVASHANASPPPQPPIPPEGFDSPGALELPSCADMKYTIPSGKPYGRRPQIPPPPGKQPAKRMALHRDIDNLIRSDPNCCLKVWEESILAGYPVSPRFTAFGTLGGGTARPPRLSAPAPRPSSPLPCEEGRVHMPTHRSIWEDHALPPTVVDDRPPGGVYTCQPDDLFTVGPGPFLDATANIASMRRVSYCKIPDGPGYAWATGVSPGSAGRRVRSKFEEDGNCRTPSMTALEEATCFTSKRSLPIPVAIDDNDLSSFTIRKVFPLGSLFKIALGTPPDGSVRSWHGTNLYCAHSVAVHGLFGKKPDHGPHGIYSFSDKQIWKIQFYCYYTLSGTGRAWTVITEIAIADAKYQAVSKIQRCSHVEDTTVVAVWLHGLHYSEFTEEIIWPRWCPECEIFSARIPRCSSDPDHTQRKAALKKRLNLSKALATLLRHKASKVGVAIRPDGFCHVADLLRTNELLKLSATVAEVEQIVRECDKQRFELRTENEQLLVRAAQGHSMLDVQDDQLLRRLSLDDSDLPEWCVHGTFARHLPSILRHGLLTGGTRSSRNHVHFTPYEPGDSRTTSGVRKGSDVAIYIDLQKALMHDVPFFMSSNHVILSPGIDGVIASDYILRLRNLRTGADLDLATAMDMTT